MNVPASPDIGYVRHCSSPLKGSGKGQRLRLSCRATGRQGSPDPARFDAAKDLCGRAVVSERQMTEYLDVL
jgi:hypothetical protein